MTTIPGPPGSSDTARKQLNRLPSAAVSWNRSVRTPAPPAMGGSGGRADLSKHMCEPRSLWEETTYRVAGRTAAQQQRMEVVGASRSKHGRRRRVALTRRGRRVLAGLSVALAVILGVVVWAAVFEHAPIVQPSDPCATPPPLRTRQGVTLQPSAMKAYR